MKQVTELQFRWRRGPDYFDAQTKLYIELYHLTVSTMRHRNPDWLELELDILVHKHELEKCTDLLERKMGTLRAVGLLVKSPFLKEDSYQGLSQGGSPIYRFYAHVCHPEKKSTHSVAILCYWKIMWTFGWLEERIQDHLPTLHFSRPTYVKKDGEWIPLAQHWVETFDVMKETASLCR